MDRYDAARMMGINEFPDGWEFIEVRRAGKASGFICRNGPEMHMWRHPDFKGRWITAKEIARAGKPVLAEYGFIKTSVEVWNNEGNIFVKRLGFSETHIKDGSIYYKTSKLTHSRD